MFKNLFSSSTAVRHGSDLTNTKELKGLLESMIEALVDEPKQIELNSADHPDGGVLFELKVSKSDLGKVIGKKGRTASAMRTILSAASRKHKISADLKILE